MGSNDKLLLRWNDFERNIGSAFYDLKEEKDFADVTLACADGQVETHKVILAASSPFFKRVLKKNPHSHPLIYLKGIKFSDVEAVLEFIYHGEVNVEEANLNTFLGVAEELEVKGLVPSRAAFPSDLSSIGYPRVSPNSMLSSKDDSSHFLVPDQGKRDGEGGSSLQSSASKFTKQVPVPGSNKQSLTQMNVQLSSRTGQESTSANNNLASDIKVKPVDTFMAPAHSEKQQQNEDLTHHQDQCSQFS